MNLIYVMRHGESVVNVERRLTCRKLEGDLSPAGREQAAKAAVWLADKNIRRISHSPFHRAQETAYIIGARLKLMPAAADDLREMDCGHLEDRADQAAWDIWTQVYHRWEAAEWEAAFPGGETFLQAFERLSRALAAVKPDETVLLVSHGGITRVVIPLLCVNAAALQRRDYLANTGMIVLEPYGDGRFICRAWNLAEHLAV
ncbi:MAG: histidine phosphatase family protein [Chloroflexi bacterium]|nr:histidine phosphatase family protein [Chloroflexota bacterium]